MARAYEMQQKRDKRKQNNDMKDTATSNMSKEDLDRLLGRNAGMQQGVPLNDISFLDIDPRRGRFNPDARGYLEMGYDQINPDSLNRPQMDPKLDAVMKMLNEMKMIG